MYWSYFSFGSNRGKFDIRGMWFFVSYLHLPTTIQAHWNSTRLRLMWRLMTPDYPPQEKETYITLWSSKIGVP
jgi:hypothetical protein